MGNEVNRIKNKRLKVVRALMFFDALLLILSLGLLDSRNLSYPSNSVNYVRIFIFVIFFVILYITEKNLSRYLRKHRNED